MNRIFLALVLSGLAIHEHSNEHAPETDGTDNPDNRIPISARKPNNYRLNASPGLFAITGKPIDMAVIKPVVIAPLII
jgi:hypothetical protein